MALLLPTGPTILPSGHSWCDTAPLGSTGFHSQTLQYYHTSHLTPHISDRPLSNKFPAHWFYVGSIVANIPLREIPLEMSGSHCRDVEERR